MIVGISLKVLTGCFQGEVGNVTIGLVEVAKDLWNGAFDCSVEAVGLREEDLGLKSSLDHIQTGTLEKVDCEKCFF